MLFLRSSSSHLAFFLFACLILVLLQRHSTAQTPPVAEPLKAQLPPINSAEFETTVQNGKPIVGRTINSADIERVLENTQLKSKLEIRNSRISGAPLHLSRPSKSAGAYPKDSLDHLSSRKVTEAVYVTRPIQISNTVFDTGLNLLSVVFENDLTFENVEFQGAVYFQGSIFQKRVLFKQVDFKEVSDFSGTLFLASATFNGCQFTQQANFSNGKLGTDAKLFFTGYKLEVPLDFSNSTVLGKITFEGLDQTLQITNKIYLNAINANLLQPAGELHLKNVEVSNNIYLDRSKWILLDFAEGASGMHRPIRLDGFCDLRDGHFVTADFAGAEFGKGGDFEGARFDTISFQRTKIREPIRISWKQLDGKLKRVNDNKPIDKDSYRQLELNFKNLNDLKGENETQYQRKTIWEGRSFAWLFTGYWVRPLRILGWLVLVFAVFAIANWIAFRRTWFIGDRPYNTLLGMLPYPLQLTLYAAALKPNVPEGFLAKRRGQCLFLVEFIIFKFLEICVVIVLSNTSPLLKQIVPYFFPG
jgi:uncharacterized protein YjbI with pentapeptide repeats